MILRRYSHPYISAWSICEWTCNTSEAKRSGESGVVNGEAGEQAGRHAWPVWGEEGEESAPAGESTRIQVAEVAFESYDRWELHCPVWVSHGHECPSHSQLECDAVWFGRHIPVFQRDPLPLSLATLKIGAAVFFSVLVSDLQNIFQHSSDTLILHRIWFSVLIPSALVVCILTSTGEVRGSYPGKGSRMELKHSSKMLVPAYLTTQYHKTWDCNMYL